MGSVVSASRAWKLLSACLVLTPGMARAKVMGGAMARPYRAPRLFFSERSADIMKPLEDQQAMLGEDVVLRCELSREGTPVRWLKDGKAIRKSQKYDLLTEGTRASLVIHAASLKDSGKYTCETESSKSTASLRVEGKPHESLGLPPGSRSVPGRKREAPSR